MEECAGLCSVDYEVSSRQIAAADTQLSSVAAEWRREVVLAGFSFVHKAESHLALLPLAARRPEQSMQRAVNI